MPADPPSRVHTYLGLNHPHCTTALTKNISSSPACPRHVYLGLWISLTLMDQYIDRFLTEYSHRPKGWSSGHRKLLYLSVFLCVQWTCVAFTARVVFHLKVYQVVQAPDRQHAESLVFSLGKLAPSRTNGGERAPAHRAFKALMRFTWTCAQAHWPVSLRHKLAL